MWTVLVLALSLLASAAPARAHDAPHHHSEQRRLPKIAPAPGFALISQDGAPVALTDLRGKVVAVTFIYTSCTDTCPMLTALMAYVQDQLGQDFGKRIAFVSITVDPDRDTPEVLKQYADTFGADLKVGHSSPVQLRPFETLRTGMACSLRRAPRATWTIRFSRRSLTVMVCFACNISESVLIPTNFGVTS